MINTGDVLPNGAVLLFMAVTGNQEAAVLCSFRNEYVTWKMDTETGVTYWGHYFGSDQNRAFTDYNERAYYA